jgi:hypothetical protein
MKIIDRDGTIMWRYLLSATGEMSDGPCFWDTGGKAHREVAPAKLDSNGTSIWFFNDRIHRSRNRGQPAVLLANGAKEWAILGRRVSPRHPTDG